MASDGTRWCIPHNCTSFLNTIQPTSNGAKCLLETVTTTINTGKLDRSRLVSVTTDTENANTIQKEVGSRVQAERKCIRSKKVHNLVCRHRDRDLQQFFLNT